MLKPDKILALCSEYVINELPFPESLLYQELMLCLFSFTEGSLGRVSGRDVPGSGRNALLDGGRLRHTLMKEWVEYGGSA